VSSQPEVNYQWTVPSGVKINSGQGTNQLNVDFVISVSGNIILTATNAFGSYSESLLVKTIILTDFEEWVEEFRTSIFPNPFEIQSEITAFSESFEPISINLFDLKGSTLKSWGNLSSPFKIQVGEGLPSGVYTLTIKENQSVHVVKLVELN